LSFRAFPEICGVARKRTMWHGKQRIWIEFAIWMTLGWSAYALTYQFDGPIQGYRLGATAWPRAIILLMIVFAVLQFTVRMRGALRTPAAAADENYWSRLRNLDKAAALKVGLTFGTPVAYVLLLPGTGFYVTTPLFLLAYLYLLGERRWGRLLLVTAFIYALMIIVFTSVFYVPLPVGNWPVFYDVNNWLLTTYR
jgi:hypothetical protein